MKGFAVVVAATVNGAIGKNGKLPWTLPEDLKWFKKVTSSTRAADGKNAIIMGRKTFESLGCQSLPGRHNIVVSRSLKSLDNATVAESLEDALSKASAEGADQIFVVGGAALYREALQHPRCGAVWWTRLCGTKNLSESCDVCIETPVVSEEVFAPVYVGQTRIKPGTVLTYDFTHWVRRELLKNETWVQGYCGEMDPTPEEENVTPKRKHLLEEFENKQAEKELVKAVPTIRHRLHEELQYLDLVAEVINHGVLTPNRTGTPARSVFGRMMRFDLKGGVFPLLTTKKTFWRGVVAELLWFLRGCTDGKELSAAGVHIWDANGSREFLDNLGFKEREVGDLGPIYGFQWRHFNAKYDHCHADYSGQGVDQLRNCIEQLKSDPFNRRILLSAWNPAALPEMALPPCHMFCQFYVDGSKRVSCAMYQRSADLGLGVPFNIASYSLLTRMIAQVVGLEAGEFVHVMGNAHVYENHVEPLKRQLGRTPLPFPALKLDGSIKDIDDFKAEHFRLVGYNPLEKVEMEMAV